MPDQNGIFFKYGMLDQRQCCFVVSFIAPYRIYEKYPLKVSNQSGVLDNDTVINGINLHSSIVRGL
jgi:hypothetical protein